MESNGVDMEGMNMDFPKIHESEYRFCLIMWEHEPVTAVELVKLCQNQLGWKRTTTYTVIKRLGDRGVLKNDNGTITSLVSKDEAQACEIDELVEKKFEGSLPAFIAAFTKHQAMVKENPDYCVRITGSDVYGKSKLDYFISVSEPYPVIATTSELLSTGADCKMTKLIVLDKTVESMTTFKQMIGRGTRIREKEGKTHFVVMDFRNVTRLFTDPEWDGPVEQHEGFEHGGAKPKGGGHGGGGKNPPDDPVETPIVDRDGCKVKIINKTVSVYDANGKLLKQEDIIDYTRTNIKGEYASLSDFIRKWKASDKKKTIEESFTAMGIDLKALKADQGMEDVDDFDFICYVAYGKKPLTREERASKVKKKDFFSKYSAEAQAVLGILLDKYMNQGITEVEDIKVLLNEQGCNIDLCGYPHEEEEILDPLDTIREYQERRTTLNAEIDKVLAELEALLPGGVIE